ncbi:hypothetical protein SESBI_10658 [Sesbania bispinosa]|nr:hypothetical protein SESBI_10658 [Sesbania bispinosa]
MRSATATLAFILLMMLSISICLAAREMASMNEKNMKNSEQLSNQEDENNNPGYGYSGTGVNNHHYIPRQDYNNNGGGGGKNDDGSG